MERQSPVRSPQRPESTGASHTQPGSQARGIVVAYYSTCLSFSLRLDGTVHGETCHKSPNTEDMRHFTGVPAYKGWPKDFWRKYCHRNKAVSARILSPFSQSLHIYMMHSYDLGRGNSEHKESKKPPKPGGYNLGRDPSLNHSPIKHQTRSTFLPHVT